MCAHDAVAQKDFSPHLPEIPIEMDEDEETIKIVQLVKSNEPLVSLNEIFLIHFSTHFFDWLTYSIDEGSQRYCLSRNHSYWNNKRKSHHFIHSFIHSFNSFTLSLIDFCTQSHFFLSPSPSFHYLETQNFHFNNAINICWKFPPFLASSLSVSFPSFIID